MNQQALFAIPDYCVDINEAERLAAGAHVLGCLSKLGTFAKRLDTDVEDSGARGRFMHGLGMFSALLVYTPSAAFYRRLCDHSDSCFFADITLRMLSGGTDVRIVTGFVRQSLTSRLIEYMEQVRGMGAELVFKEAPYTQKAGPLELVTAKEVVSSFNRGQKELIVGSAAVITPLARDEAKEKGILILKQGG